MYAVVDHKGKQYRVSPGEEILVDHMRVPVGELVEFDRILMVGQEKGSAPRVGQPRVEGARVLAEVIRHEKGPKLVTLRYHASSGPHQTKKGHRQLYTRVKVQEIHPE